MSSKTLTEPLCSIQLSYAERCSLNYGCFVSYCQKLCMGLSCGGAILAFSIHEFDASNDLGELI